MKHMQVKLGYTDKKLVLTQGGEFFADAIDEETAKRIVQVVNGWDELYKQQQSDYNKKLVFFGKTNKFESENAKLKKTLKNIDHEYHVLKSKEIKLREALEKARGLIEASIEEVKMSNDIWDDVIYSVNEALNSKL